MELHLKIDDVVGMDDDGKHVIRFPAEDLKAALLEKPGWVIDEIIRPLMKTNTRLIAEALDNNELRNTIYMQEKAAREAKAEKRERKRLFEIERQRRADQHKASIATRKALDFYHDVLGIED